MVLCSEQRSAASGGPPRNPARLPRSREPSPRPQDRRRQYVVADLTFNQRPQHLQAPVNHTSLPTNARAHHHRSPSRSRRSRPPYAIVEDEKASLAKEVNPMQADADQWAPPHRGSVDQRPPILPLEESDEEFPYSWLTGGREAHQRRNLNLHVDVPDEIRSAAARANQEHDQHHDETELRKTTEFVDFAERGQRPAAPYAYTPPREQRQSSLKSSPIDSAYSSSSTDLQHEKRKQKQARASKDSAISDALRGQGKVRGNLQDRRSDGLALDNGKAHVATIPPRDDSVPLQGTRPSARETPARPRLAGVKTASYHRSRRNSDTATTLPNSAPRDADSTATWPADPPLLASLAAKNAFDKASDSFSDISSRPSSPAPSYSTVSPPSTPGDLDRYKWLPHDGGGRRPGRTPHAGSKPSSRAPSPEEKVKRNRTFPDFHEGHSRRHRRHLSSASSIDHDPPRDAYGPYQAPRPAKPLPYPVDDNEMMPLAEHHHYQPLLPDETVPSMAHARRDVPPHPVRSNTQTRYSAVTQSARPPIRQSRTANDVVPTLSRYHCDTAGSLVSSPVNTPPQTTFGTPCAPDSCPLSRPTSAYRDWHTLEGLPGFNICLTCLQGNFEGTEFRDYFRRAESTDLRRRTKCDFANEWIRLAWLITQRQNRHDLGLVYTMARIGINERDEPCPGDHFQDRSWYTLVDGNGANVRNFNVCKSDMDRIIALVPQLHNAFVKKYDRKKNRKCDLRTQSYRFVEYLDTLYGIVETAARERRPPNVQTWIGLVKYRAQYTECRRGELLSEQDWHYHPALPELTVCGDCYMDVVWPERLKRSKVAAEVDSTPRKLPGASRSQHDEASCQLYSPRMRKLFYTACLGDDLDLLRDVVIKRRKAELRIKPALATLRETRQKLKRASMEGRNKDEMERTERAMWKLESEWAQFE